MNKIVTRLRQLKYHVKHDLFKFDNIILMLAFVSCVAWTYGAISSMSRNWELEQRLLSKKRELALLKLETETQELENEYYRSEEYQELAARQEHDRAAPGEVLLYLPSNSTAAKTKYQPEHSRATSQVSNFDQWLLFLFGTNFRSRDS